MSDKPPIHLGIEHSLGEMRIFKRPILGACCRWLAKCLDRLLCWTRYNRFVDQLDLEMDFLHFMNECVDHYQLDIENKDHLLDRIPKTGGLIVMANHPSGFAETVLLPHMIMKVRPDLRIMANEMLANVHWIKPQIIPLNVYASQGVRKILKAAEDWLRDGHVLLVFPSGEVADYKKDRAMICDSAWSRLPVILSRKTQAELMHINIDVHTSKWFHIVTRICKPARVLWMMYEMYRQGGRHIPCYGSSINSLKKLPALSDADQVDYLQRVNDCLPLRALYGQSPVPIVKADRVLQPLPSLVVTNEVIAEVAELPQSALLYSHRHIQVFAVAGADIPHLMDYIQLAREWVFREVDMGTGKERDGDRHDAVAMQVIAWDTNRQALVAATRCELITAQHMDGYLGEFYDINYAELVKTGEMMEVSRSFVMPDYQRSFSSLLCLWRGNAKLVMRHPKLRYMSGVVSMGADVLNQVTLDCFASYIALSAQRNNVLSGYYRAKNPYMVQHKVPKQVEYCLQSIMSVSQLQHFFGELSGESCAFPVLFQQYESLGLIPLGISIDEDFGDSIDVLHVWDMRQLNSKKLRPFFAEKDIEELIARASDD